MATPEDYIGGRFGPFVITELLGSGLERDVFGVVQEARQAHYALKLHSENDALWDGEPLLPPPNGAHERGEVTTTWEMTRYSDPDATDFIVDAFLVLDNGYVTAANRPWRPRGSLNADQLARLPRPAGPIGDMIPIYDDALMMMFAEAAMKRTALTAEEWDKRWGLLTGGEHLLEKLEPLLHEHPEVRPRFTRPLEGRPELADNLFVRFCEACNSGTLSVEQGTLTLRSTELDRNVALVEIEQLAALRRIFHGGSASYRSQTLERATQWVDFCLHFKAQGPIDPVAERDLLEPVEDQPPTITDADTVLYAG